MEQLFASFKNSNRNNSLSNGSYDPDNPEAYADFIHALIEDSRDYETSTLSGDRDYAQKYYYGLLPTLEGDDPASAYSDTVAVDANSTYDQVVRDTKKDVANRSTYISTDVKDAVMMMLPSLIRLFGASESPVELVPRTAAESDMAEQATNYINYTFWNENDGFLNLYGAFKDALTVRTGFLKWWTDNQKEMRRKTFVNITPGQLQGEILQSSPGARVVEHTGVDPALGTFAAVTVEYQIAKPIHRVCGVPPEEMRLDKYARTFRESRIVGHERIVSIDELTGMGYKREDLLDYVQGQSVQENTSEVQMRNPGRLMANRVGEGVKFGEWYIRADQDGDSHAELRHIITMGEEADIISDEPANRIKFALFSCDPISHTIVGQSLADYVIDIQRLKTNSTRALLDSAAESINPKMAINELNVTVDDALNDDLGAVIRVRGDPNAAIAYTNTPFLGKDMIPVLQMFDETLQRRTGLSDAAKGLDPKALQSSTMIGVEAIINGQQERTELVARVLCETGFKDLFAGLFNEVCENPSPQRTLKINGKWTDYDASTFDASMGVEVNPTLGKGSDTIRLMTLQQIKQDQQMIIAQMGISNPVCGLPEMMNTQTDMLAIANIKNVGRYFKTPDPQAMQQLLSTPKEPDAMTIAAQAQYQKAKADAAAALGDQEIRKTQLSQEHEQAMSALQEKTLYDQQKLDIERDKIHAQHVSTLGQMAADIFKTHSDVHVAHAQMDADQQIAETEAAATRAAAAEAETPE